MLGVAGVALLGLALYLGLRASRWERIERFVYLATAVFAASGGVLLVAAAKTEHIALSGSFIGYVVASSGFGWRKRDFSSLEAERAWNRFEHIMARNKWFNLTLGVALMVFSLWRFNALSQ